MISIACSSVPFLLPLDFYVLPGGGAVRGDLVRILNKLMKRRDKFDAILIETTGLANPGPVIQTFFMDEDIKGSCQLDAVVTVVDCKHITQHLDDEKPDGVVNEAGTGLERSALQHFSSAIDRESSTSAQQLRGNPVH
jgi:G3E family GTPase